MTLSKWLIPVLLAGLVGIFAGVVTPAAIAAEIPYPGTQVIKTPFGFKTLHQRLEAAVEKNKVFVVTRASASAGAKGRGITIPGNLVIGVYRNDFAVRMLKASVPAGIEAPLRFYLTENADKTATLTYRQPSAVFKPYDSKDLDALASE
ncbi:MAG: DUF302 domain-containing protein, partial [Rhodospirillaceae bacterium]